MNKKIIFLCLSLSFVHEVSADVSYRDILEISITSGISGFRAQMLKEIYRQWQYNNNEHFFSAFRRLIMREAVINGYMHLVGNYEITDVQGDQSFIRAIKERFTTDIFGCKRMLGSLRLELAFYTILAYFALDRASSVFQGYHSTCFESTFPSIITNEVCGICYEHKDRMVQPCPHFSGHLYCEECIAGWHQQGDGCCPECRLPLGGKTTLLPVREIFTRIHKKMENLESTNTLFDCCTSLGGIGYLTIGQYLRYREVKGMLSMMGEKSTNPIVGLLSFFKKFNKSL